MKNKLFIVLALSISATCVFAAKITRVQIGDVYYNLDTLLSH